MIQTHPLPRTVGSQVLAVGRAASKHFWRTVFPLVPRSNDVLRLVEGNRGGSCSQALSTRSPPGPENNSADHQCLQRNSKKPAGQSTISYDYSEEELMASIEREYCR